MPYTKNQAVLVASLKRQGVIVERLHDGKYRVAVGSMVVECAEKDLKALAPGAVDKSQHSQGPRKHHPALSPKKPTKDAPTLDLHGLTVEEAMAKVTHAIDRAIIEDIERLRILHGVGTGRIMDALHKYLKTLDVVAEFKLDQSNRGVTWVYF